jgi:nicotinamidase-related amidase
MTEMHESKGPVSLRPEIFQDQEVAERFRPEHTAIIVVDMQAAYCDPNAPWPKSIGAATHELEATSDRIAAFLQEARNFSPSTIVFTRFEEKIATAPGNVGFIMKYDKAPEVISEKDGVGWDYYNVEPQEGDHEVEKKAYNAFRGTDLDAHLRSKGVRSIILIGGYRSVCVASTAFAASQLYDYNTLIPNDLTANLDSPEGSQRGMIEDLELISLFTVPNYIEILQSWEKHAQLGEQ